MDFINQSIIVGINLRDLEFPKTSHHIQAEIVLIDKSSDVLQPLLYQLKTDVLNNELDTPVINNPGFLTLEKNSFLMMGEVLEINKTKKQIYLKNEDTVSYKHLIIASGLKQTASCTIHNDELASGLHALIEALRVRKNSSKALQFPDINRFDFQKNKNPYSAKIGQKQFERAIDLNKIIKESITVSTSTNLLDNIIGSMEKRLYELQL